MPLVITEEKILQDWTKACYAEAAAKELEETVLRRLAAQCDITLDSHPYRHGTRYLQDGLRLTADGVVVPHNASGSEQSLREGAHFNGSELWAKARRRFSRKHPGVAVKQGMPLNHPYHRHGGNSSEHFNYDSQSLHLYNFRKAEQEKQGNNSSKGKGKGSGNWNDPNYIQTVGPYINPRYSLPIGWNRTDSVASIDETMQLQEPLYAAFNQAPFPTVGTAILPDMMLLTSEVPWRMIAGEFQVMHAENMNMSKDAERSPRMGGRSSSRGSFDFPSYSRTVSGVSALSSTSSHGSGDDLKAAGANEDAQSTGRKRGRGRLSSAASEGEIALSSSNKKRTASSLAEAEDCGSPRGNMARSQSSLGLGLSHQALKEAEVSVAGFRESTFDIRSEVAKLSSKGVVAIPEASHKYIKIAIPSELLVGGGNSNTFEAVPDKPASASASTSVDSGAPADMDDPWANFSAPYASEDMSDEAVNYRHELGLKNIRDRWMKLSRLKRERKMSMTGGDGFPGSPRMSGAGGSPRASWSGNKARRKMGGHARSRAGSTGATNRFSLGSAGTVSAPNSTDKKGRPGSLEAYNAEDAGSMDVCPPSIADVEVALSVAAEEATR